MKPRRRLPDFAWSTDFVRPADGADNANVRILKLHALRVLTRGKGRGIKLGVWKLVPRRQSFELDAKEIAWESAHVFQGMPFDERMMHTKAALFDGRSNGQYVPRGEVLKADRATVSKIDIDDLALGVAVNRNFLVRCVVYFDYAQPLILQDQLVVMGQRLRRSLCKDACSRDNGE